MDRHKDVHVSASISFNIYFRNKKKNSYSLLYFIIVVNKIRENIAILSHFCLLAINLNDR